MKKTTTWLPQFACDFKLRTEVHVWRVPLNIPDKLLNQLFQLLNKDENDRANRFHFEKDRKRYISTRGHLRVLLGKYLKQEPDTLVFRYNKYGKPFLTDNSIEFNVSHSNDLGLIAFDQDQEIGVDIEWMRPDFGGLKIAKRFFSSEEVLELEALPPDEQAQGFFNCWSRKEAYIKALGKGLAIPLDKFSVNLSPGIKAVLLSTTHNPQALYNYKLFNIKTDPDYASALICDKSRNDVKLFDLISGQFFD